MSAFQHFSISAFARLSFSISVFQLFSFCPGNFSISAFQLFSFSLGAVTLKSDPTLSQLRHHGCKNRKQFIGFVQQLIGRSASNAAIIA